MGLSPKVSRRNVHFKEPKTSSVVPAVTSAAQMPSNSGQKVMGPGGPLPTCQCPQYIQHPQNLSTASQFCQIHKTSVGPTQTMTGPVSSYGIPAQNVKKPVRDVRTPPNTGSNKMQAGPGPVVSNANNLAPNVITNANLNFNSNYGIMPAAVLAYMNNNKQCSLVPNARVAFEMFHSMGKSVDYDPNTVEDFDDSDEDEAEEEDYDQLISCSEWGDVSEIS